MATGEAFPVVFLSRKIFAERKEPMIPNGKVPMFKMRPHKVSLVAACCVLILGVLFFFEGRRDPGNVPAHERANLILAISIVLSGVLFIISTGRMWFSHLWHDRYK